ncbi:MAG: hypothetical protein Q9227_008482 [Pyrenula ochraceoflavens]
MVGQTLFLSLLLLRGSLAFPQRETSQRSSSKRVLSRASESKFEWTALGDSYASGVGSVDYVDGRRCLRYDQAYPVLLDKEDLAPGQEHDFHNVVCSGAEADEIEKYQFYDTDQTFGQPNWQYYPRPKFGQPTMATLHVGGDDIDFRGLLQYCVVEIFAGNDPIQACKDQRDKSWKLLKSTDLVDKIDSVIKKTVDKGRSGPIGDKFKLYLVSYAEFFNSEDPACNDVTFARTANPNPDNNPHNKMTTDLRKDLNAMSIALNKAISDAVDKNKNNGVKFIDLQKGKKFGDDDDPLKGHRFCEKGIKEPDQDNDQLYFWHYPYNAPDNDYTKLVDSTAQDVVNGMSSQDIQSKWATSEDFWNDVFGKISEDQFNGKADSNHTDTQVAGWDSIGYRARVFHPQVRFHTYIKDQILDAWKQDRDIDGTGSGGGDNNDNSDPRCQGNQVQLSDCQQQHYPSDMPDFSGPQQPICNKVDTGDNPFLKINADKAQQAAATYCANLKSSKIVLNAQNTQPGKSGIQPDAAENGGDAALSVLFDIKACPTDKKTTSIDFSTYDQTKCVENFYGIFNQICVIDSTWGSYDKDYTLMGGVFLNDCAMWGLVGQPHS